MPADCKRIQKRTPATVALQIASAGQPFITELAFTENVSLHGVRVVTGQLTRRPGCNGACVETRRARDREVLPRQHPITGKGNLLSSSGEETIRRWIGTAFSGWDVGGRFATRKSRSVAQHSAGLGDGKAGFIRPGPVKCPLRDFIPDNARIRAMELRAGDCDAIPYLCID